MKQTIVGVIGVGRIGKMHTENMVLSIPNIYIKSISDPHIDKDWVASLNIPVATNNNQILYDDPEIEAIVIAAPSAFHVKLIKEVAKAGKSIFCEKPIAFVPEHIQEAIDAVEQAGVQLFVGYNRRFDASFMKVHEHVKKGDIGDVQIVKIVNRDPKRPRLEYIPNSGGLFMDFTAHDFDMARFITGSEVQELTVMGEAFLPGVKDAGDIDTALLTLRMNNGALVSIDNSREALYGYDQRLEVFGSKGSVQANNEIPTQVVLSNTHAVTSEKPFYSFVERYQEAYLNELKVFSECLINHQKFPIGGKDALKVVQIALAAQKSQQENCLVNLS